MELFLLIVGIVLGAFVTVLIYESDGCEHDYILESSQMAIDETFKLKHYQCTKCQKVKTVRIG